MIQFILSTISKISFEGENAIGLEDEAHGSGQNYQSQN